MQYRLVLLGAAIAQLSGAHEHGHAHLHAKRSSAEVTETVVDIEYVTVTDYVTVTPGGNGEWLHSWSHPPTTAPAASPSVVSSAAPSYSSSTPTVAPVSESPSSFSSSIPAPATSPSSYETSTAPSPSSSSAVPTSATSSASASSSGISLANLSPNGKKAGLSGFVGIQDISAFGDFAPYISWYSDYTPNTPNAQGVTGIGMVWGAAGSACGSTETDRLDTFTSMVSGGTVPDIMFGFYEPDCDCPDSSEMSVSSAASDWDSLLAPLGSKGTILGSPSMCTQYNEDFLTPFNSAISRTWDVTSIHINKPNLTEAQEDVEYYVNKYGKPVWVSEFACVYDQPSWQPCTDQGEIDTFINDVVSYFESNDNVVAYGPSNGAGLGDVWPLTDSNGDLTASGQTYLSAIKGL